MTYRSKQAMGRKLTLSRRKQRVSSAYVFEFTGIRVARFSSDRVNFSWEHPFEQKAPKFWGGCLPVVLGIVYLE